MQAELTCSEKFSLESIVTPKCLRVSAVFLIVSVDHCTSDWFKNRVFIKQLRLFALDFYRVSQLSFIEIENE